MTGPKSVDRGLYWRSVFERYAESGLSVRRFCQENGISQSTFFAWRKKVGKEPSMADGGRVGASSRSLDGKSQARPSFVAVKLPIASEPIEIAHPLGYVVRVASGANLDSLIRIFQILDQHASK